MDVEEISDEWSKELKRGSIQLGILALLSEGRKYGFQMIRELRELTDGFLDLKEGTLYPALHRLEKLRLLESEWVIEGSNPPRKYYRLTKKGAAMLAGVTKELWDFERLFDEAMAA